MQTDLSLKELLKLPPVPRERPAPAPLIPTKIKVVLLALLVLALAAVGAWGYYLSTTIPVVPDVITLTQSDAAHTAQRAGMSLEVVGTLYSVEPAGHVIEQSPHAGAEPFFTRTLQVVVSSGKQEIVIPELIGESEIRARSLLEMLGLTVQTAYEYSPELVGAVISTTPLAGESVETGDIIIMRVGAPRSQVALVEYDLQGKTVVISVAAGPDDVGISEDIALRLTSFLQAAQATVLAGHEPASEAAAYLQLSTADHASNIVHVQGAAAVESELPADSLAKAIISRMHAIPASTSYAHVHDPLPFEQAAVVAFGTDDSRGLYRDNRWKDNLARSLYLALGETLMR